MNLDMFSPESHELTVLSFGAGQDSTVLADMLINDPAFRAKYAPGRLLVVMSNTGDEFDETYAHVERMKQRFADAGIEFVFITSDMGYHSDSWLNLRHFYREKGTIGSKSYPKTCSDRLKIQPIYRFLEDWLAKNYGVRAGRKNGFKEFAARFGKIKMMIGIAKGEEKRAAPADQHSQAWYRDSIENVYPLLDMGMGRAECQDYLHERGMYVIPSNCKGCPFMSLAELEYLRRFEQGSLKDLIALEQAKLDKHGHLNSVVLLDANGEPALKQDGRTFKTANRNYGVWGVKTLPEKLIEAAEKHASWSDEQVREYRYSHGHCVATAF